MSAKIVGDAKSIRIDRQRAVAVYRTDGDSVVLVVEDPATIAVVEIPLAQVEVLREILAAATRAVT